MGNDSHPWVSINALLNPTNDYDFYKVELQAGETITVDIDYGQSQGLPVDTYIRGLYNSNYGAAFPLMMTRVVPVEAAVVRTAMTLTYNIQYLKPAFIM